MLIILHHVHIMVIMIIHQHVQQQYVHVQVQLVKMYNINQDVIIGNLIVHIKVLVLHMDVKKEHVQIM